VTPAIDNDPGGFITISPTGITDAGYKIMFRSISSDEI